MKNLSAVTEAVIDFMTYRPDAPYSHGEKEPVITTVLTGIENPDAEAILMEAGHHTLLIWEDAAGYPGIATSVKREGGPGVDHWEKEARSESFLYKRSRESYDGFIETEVTIITIYLGLDRARITKKDNMGESDSFLVRLHA